MDTKKSKGEETENQDLSDVRNRTEEMVSTLHGHKYRTCDTAGLDLITAAPLQQVAILK